MSIIKQATLVAFFLLGACGAAATPPQSVVPAASAGTITIFEPRVRLPVTGQNRTAAYLTFTNSGHQPDQLIEATSIDAQAVELHAHLKTADGMMAMREVSQIDLPAGGTILLSPGGLHLMIKGVKPGLKLGDTLALNLKFQSGAEARFQAPVVANPALEQNRSQADKAGHKH